MKTLVIARKFLLEIVREPMLVGLELALPLIFLILTKMMYNLPTQSTYSIWLSGSPSAIQAIEAELQTQQYPDGRPIFALTKTNNPAAAEAALKDKSAAALLVAAADGSYTLRGDAISIAFYHASTLLENSLRRYALRQAGKPEILRLVESGLAQGNFTAGSPQTLFDLYAPGMIVFAILLLIPQTAMLTARELRWRTLRRLRLARLKAWELLAGVSLSQMAVAVVQMLIIFPSAQWLGFHMRGSLLLAMIAGLTISFSAVGLGLIVACFVENDSQAANIGGVISMLQVFLSGAWFALPPMTVFSLAGHQIDLFDIFPATSGFLALQQTLTFGANLGQISFRLLFTLLLSAVYFIVGVYFFQRRQMCNP